MRAVVTRVRSASVTIEERISGAIEQGYLILLGVGPNDTPETAEKLAEKICNLRIFEDENGKMNRNLEQVSGSILVVSTPPAAVRGFPAQRSRSWRRRCTSGLWSAAGSGGLRCSTGNSARICRWRRSTTGL